jgi:Asp-tRNA(Asn)/Glu-tRNA(Gln) amidotransferase B subunit
VEQTILERLQQLPESAQQEALRFIDELLIKHQQPKQVMSRKEAFRIWQRATPSERAREFREWVLQLPKGSPSLPDEAFNRDSIYE